ncbi:MAG: tandem-95 repeat protein [bacterium]|nr:tandem-95 repeat protein [bacterium]
MGVALASDETPVPVREGDSGPVLKAPRAQPPLVIMEGEPVPVGEGFVPELRAEPVRRAVESTVGQVPVDESADAGRRSTDKSGAAPKVMDDFFTVKVDEVLQVAVAAGVLTNDYDPEGDAVSVTLVTDNVDHGSLSVFVNGRFNYTPDAGYAGYDYFDYRVSDGTSNVEIGRVHLQVVATDRPPVAQDEAYVISKDTPLQVLAASGLLVNDIDPDGESVAVNLITDYVDHGTLNAFAPGNFTYTPDSGYTGTDSFIYQISANGVHALATTTITVFDPNRAPLATSDLYYVPIFGSIAIPAAAGVLRNDLDPDGDAISVTLVTNAPDHGALTLFLDGHFTYAPTFGFSGIDRFTYRMKDAKNATASATVTIYVGVTSDPASPGPLPPTDAQRFGMSLPTPNPFNPTTRIDFRVDGKARTTMSVFDLRGALVRTLVDEDLPAGDHTVQWDGRDDQGVEVASGAYFVALMSGSDLPSR